MYEIVYDKALPKPALALTEEFAFGTVNDSVILEASDTDVKVGTLG
jgi:hypothetical protein